jgi:hypothetical protein
MPIERDDVVHAVVAGLAARGVPPAGNAEVLAASDQPGAVALRVGGTFAIGVMADPRGGVPAWVLPVPVDQAGLLARLVAETHAKLELADPTPAAPDGFTVLSVLSSSPGEGLRAVLLEAETFEEAGFALWRVRTDQAPQPVYALDVVGCPFARAHELGIVVREGVAALGTPAAPGSTALN